MPGGALATLLLAAAAAAAAGGLMGLKKRHVRPSVPCCFGAGRCSCYSFVSSSSSNGCFGAGRCFWAAAAAGELMGLKKRKMFVLPCLAVSVPGGALATLLLAAAAAAATAVLVPGGATLLGSSSSSSR